jgi:HEAT repeat protein
VSALDITALALSACSVLMLAVLVARRTYLKTRDRHRRDLEDGLKPIALELVHAGQTPPDNLSVEQKEALADILGRYARAVHGATHQRIVEYFAREGTIDSELSVLASARASWRRATAAFRLGDIGNESAIPGLIAALHDSDREVRTAAARSLGHLRAPDAPAELVTASIEGRVPVALVGWSLLQIGSPVVEQMRSVVSSSDAGQRAAAMQMIGLLGGPGDAAAAEAHLRDDAAPVRAQAARALGRLGSERNLRALTEALEDRIPAVREAAAKALGQLRDRRSLDALAEHAADDEFRVARAAAQAMTRIDPAAAAEAGRAKDAVHLLEATDVAAIS